MSVYLYFFLFSLFTLKTYQNFNINDYACKRKKINDDDVSAIYFIKH